VSDSERVPWGNVVLHVNTNFPANSQSTPLGYVTWPAQFGTMPTFDRSPSRRRRCPETLTARACGQRDEYRQALPFCQHVNNIPSPSIHPSQTSLKANMSVISRTLASRSVQPIRQSMLTINAARSMSTSKSLNVDKDPQSGYQKHRVRVRFSDASCR
jgi:hypothetical protein